MANHKSAEKEARKALKRKVSNHSRLSRIRTFVKKVESLVPGKTTPAEAMDLLRAAESELRRGAAKGVLHKNTAARKTARLAKRVKALTSKAS